MNLASALCSTNKMGLVRHCLTPCLGQKRGQQQSFISANPLCYETQPRSSEAMDVPLESVSTAPTTDEDGAGGQREDNVTYPTNEAEKRAVEQPGLVSQDPHSNAWSPLLWLVLHFLVTESRALLMSAVTYFLFVRDYIKQMDLKTLNMHLGPGTTTAMPLGPRRRVTRPQRIGTWGS